MDLLKLLIGFLKEIIPTLTSFFVGRKSKELENVKSENEKLKKYKKIDEKNINKNTAYDEEYW